MSSRTRKRMLCAYKKVVWVDKWLSRVVTVFFVSSGSFCGSSNEGLCLWLAAMKLAINRLAGIR